MGKTITLGQFLMGLATFFISLCAMVWNQAQKDAKVRADIDNLQKMRETDEQWKRDVISQIKEGQIETRAYQRRADDNFTQILVTLRDKQDRK